MRKLALQGLRDRGSAKVGNSELLERAREVLPSGSFGNMTSHLVVREGRGGHIWDEDGREFIDYVLGSGPMLLGHAHPAVIAAVQEQISRGTTFFAVNRLGINLAEEISRSVACAERVRFVSSGTEADLYAVRLARAFTGKDKLLKFEGGYHGMGDWSLMSLAPRRQANFPTPIPDSPGIPKSVEGDVLVAPFNDLEAAARLIEANKDELGCVIVEPFQRLLKPVPGFLEGLRRLTAEHGIPLVFDEVVTGFRLAYGGAQEYFGVVPDLCTLGKICGGGFPLGAIAGRADIMALLDREQVGDERFVPQIGTLSGNPVAATAGLATLAELRQAGTYDRLFAIGRELMADLSEQMQRAGIAAQVVGMEPIFDVVFATGPMRTYRDLQRGNAAAAQKFNDLLRERQIMKPESKYYISLAHSAEDVAATKAAWASAIDELVRSGLAPRL